MARLIIDNIGPVQHADVDVKKLTILIGPQSSGKSTIAKIFSFCCWLDKMTDGTHKALDTGAYWNLITYNRLSQKALTEKSRIRYFGENIIYEYNYQESTITPDVPYSIYPCRDSKERCYEFVNRTKSPKVEYIPAERNFVSAVSNLYDYLEDDDCMQDFVSVWYRAKKVYTKDNTLDILGMGMQYYYQESTRDDLVRLSDGNVILLENASSGIQSVVPLLGLVNYFTKTIYQNQSERPFSPAEYDKIKELLSQQSKDTYNADAVAMVERLIGFAKGVIYSHTQLILEEPEQNLFPNTQCQLVNFLLGSINHGKDHRLLLTTHSPYILNYLNVLLQRSSENDVFFAGKDLSVYRICEGVTTNLLGQDDRGRYLVDSIDLNEMMEAIYHEFVSLRKG